MIQKVILEIKDNRRNGHRQIKLFSELLLEERHRSAGHNLRTSEADPLRQVSYVPNSAESYPVGKKWVGGPQRQWLQYFIPTTMYGRTFYTVLSTRMPTRTDRTEILTEARSRRFYSCLLCAHGLSSCQDYGERPWHSRRTAILSMGGCSLDCQARPFFGGFRLGSLFQYLAAVAAFVAENPLRFKPETRIPQAMSPRSARSGGPGRLKPSVKASRRSLRREPWKQDEATIPFGRAPGQGRSR